MGGLDFSTRKGKLLASRRIRKKRKIIRNTIKVGCIKSCFRNSRILWKLNAELIIFVVRIEITFWKIIGLILGCLDWKWEGNINKFGKDLMNDCLKSLIAIGNCI